jgi:serine protease
MNFGTRARHWAARSGVAAIAVVAASAGTQAATAAPVTGAPTAAARHIPVANPYAPAFHHPYRDGAVPTRAAAARMGTWARQNPGATAAPTAFSPAATKSSANNVNYGGGNTDGIGVMTGDERVFLVFYGSQWGTEKTTNAGLVTFSNDPSGEAPYLQELFQGLGTGNDQWSGVMTQYCQGVTLGAQTCPSNAPHVAYPHGGALAGVWYDNGATSPAHASGHRLGLQAVAAATHFGNTTAAANRDASYVIVSPTGTHPDGFNTKLGNFCAWHDYTGDSQLTDGPVTTPPGYGQLAFTNMPYVTNAGAGCGQNFVRSGKAGLLDGVSIVVGHEYAETITDQEPPFGWVDSSGDEAADKCAWKRTGDGKVALLSLPTGTFAMQGIWANNANGGQGGCRFSQTIKTTQLLQNPGFEKGTLAGWDGTPPGVLHKNTKTNPAHAGSWLALLGGNDTLSQQVTVAPPDGTTGGTYGAATFSFWLEIKTNDTGKKADETLKVQVLGANGVTLATFSNLNAASGYVQHSFSLAPDSYMHNGQPVPITLEFTCNQVLTGHTTSFLIDDTALNAS